MTEDRLNSDQYIQELQDVVDLVLPGGVVSLIRPYVIRVTYNKHTPEFLCPKITGIPGLQKPFVVMLKSYYFGTGLW